jgi:hypothetical protein
MFYLVVMPEQVTPPSAKAPWYVSTAMQVIMLPGGVAILVLAVLFGMMTGIIPSTFTTDISTIKNDVTTIKNGQITIMQEHVELKQYIADVVAAGNKQDEVLIKLLRGICILQSKTSADQLQYCNP